jgi:hypothetical protein
MTFEQRIDTQQYFSLLFSALLAAILFHPFFLGKFTVAGTDLLFGHYPNLIFGHREFQEFGRFSLWNRYIFAGADITSSMHAHFLNPLYWPLLLFPEKYIFHVLTFLFMVMNALTGWIWFKISAHFGLRGYQSLLVATVSQAGMFFWFAMTTMIAVPMYLFASFACLLILTRNNRGALSNFVMLSVTLGLLFVTPHPAYIIGFFLPVGAVFLCNAYPDLLRKPWRGYPSVFIAACVTALILAAYRLLPVFNALINDGSVVGNIPWLAYLNDAYFGLTVFNPLAFGIQIGEAMHIAEMVGYGSGIHTQFHNALYFGIAPLIIIYVALRTGAGTKAMLIGFAVIAAQLAYLYAFQPISDVVQMIFHPLIHGAVFRLSSNFAFLFLLIFCIRHIVTVDRTALTKAIRECVLISGFVLMAAAGMYGRLILHKFQAGEIETDMPLIINGFRFALLSILVCMALIYRLDTTNFARYQFGLFGAILGGVIVVFFDALAVVMGILPGNEITMAVFKNTLAVILVCFSIVLFARLDTLKMWRRMALFCGCIAISLLLITLNPNGTPKVGISSWATVIGWGVFIALVAVVLNIFGRWANRDIEVNAAMGLLVTVTFIDLVASFSNYSYVNIYSASPYYRSLADVYPGLTPAYSNKVAQYSVDMAQERGQRNLLVNNELTQTSDQVDGWVFGGKNMGLCPPIAKAASVSRQDTIELCYPASDRGGNLFQDVTLVKPVRKVSVGAWLRAEPGMSVALFLTSPSISTAVSSIVQHEGDGQWHWLNTDMEATSDLIPDVRAHVNLQKAGSAKVYAPRLVYGSVVQPDRRPSDGRGVVEPGNAYPLNIDLDSYRVNHVTRFNGVALNETMANFAMVYGTPTYAGVDSDQSRDFIALLSNFKDLDPSWFHRAGLLSVIEDERLLNLFGVGYDFGADGKVASRPDAIPRIAAFSGFEVQSDRKQALERIKSEDFDTTKFVLLPEAPVLASSSDTKLFQRLTYDMPEADKVRVEIAADTNRLILFNDQFSSNWEAQWNGKPLVIQRANTLFMVVAVPQGKGELTFDFRPLQFFFLSKVSAITAVIILFLALILIYLRLKNGAALKTL